MPTTAQVVYLDKLAKRLESTSVSLALVAHGADLEFTTDSSQFTDFFEALESVDKLPIYLEPLFFESEDLTMPRNSVVWLVDADRRMLWENVGIGLEQQSALSEVVDSLLSGSPPGELTDPELLPSVSERLIVRRNADERLKEATRGLHREYDDIRGLTFYRDHSSPEYVNKDAFYCYISVPEGEIPFLRLRIQYEADNWLFIKSMNVKVDDRRYYFDMSALEGKRDNDHGRIWEWFDGLVLPDTELMELIKAIADANTVRIRYNGTNYYDETTLSSRQIEAIEGILEAFEATTSAYTAGVLSD